jgi:hypothetical protein
MTDTEGIKIAGLILPRRDRCQDLTLRVRQLRHLARFFRDWDRRPAVSIHVFTVINNVNAKVIVDVIQSCGRRIYARPSFLKPRRQC